MKLKSMLKFVLAALFLGAGASAFAQVQLATGGNPISWEDFAKVINNPSSAGVSQEIATALENAQKEYDAAYKFATGAATEEGSAAYAVAQAQATVDEKQAAYDRLNNQLTQLKTARSKVLPQTQDQPITWLQDMITNADEAVLGYYDAMQGMDSEATVDYLVNTVNGRNFLYLSFVSSSSVPVTGKTWTTATMSDFDKFLHPAVAVTYTSIYVWFGDRTTTTGATATKSITITKPADVDGILENAYTALEAQSRKDGYHSVTFTQAYQNYTTQIEEIEGEDGTGGTLATAKAELETANRTLTTAKDAQSNAGTRLTAAREALNTAQTNYDNAQANALEAYNDVTLTADVTVSTTINKTYTGTINGGGKIITSTVPVFKNFSGVMHDVAVNGTFADVYNNASFSDVAVWTGSTSTSPGRFYAEDGTLTKDLKTIADLGYAARALYGVNWTTGKIVAKTDLTTVHQVTTYSFTDQTGDMVYAQVNADKNNFVSETGAALIEENKFVKADNSDFPATLSNVFYQTKNGYVCPKATIVDKNNLYVPAKINVGTLNYARTFSEGLSTACLPFAVSATASDEAIYNENIDYVATFDQLAGNNFWFTQKDKSVAVAAYTPVLINATASFSFGEISNAILPKTDAQYTKDQGNEEERSFSVGTAVKATPATLLSNVDATGLEVYGLATKTKEFQRAADNSSFAALRMFVVSDYTGPNGAPRKIIVFDEDGVEVDSTDAIVTVEAADNSVNVATTQGQIIFTSEADYGTVQIYTLDGKVAANVEVMAGTTTVDMPQGLYIVMGKKVMVK